MTIQIGDQIKHDRFGIGEVQLIRTNTALVRFEHGFEERPLSEFQLILSPLTNAETGNFQPLRELVLKCQSLTIRSINDSWGVFSISRINLLPHQLWVCHKVLRRWPMHMLIADDVGLGKTIEAGLILWPLIAKKRVKRLLVITPSSLVNQWEERMRKMFDIRLTPYVPSLDTPKSDYWNTNHFVVASLPTLRQDHNGRHERMLMAENWDLLIVDEAHHLNAIENQGASLGYQFIKKMVEHNKLESRLFFSATPHRGKDYSFFALLHLLKPETFDQKNKSDAQRDHVGEVVIRNNKQFVVDMEGNKLFKSVQSHPKTYSFSKEEKEFYEVLSSFIITGKTYASSLSKTNRNTVNLVLTAIQKLAASSVAAIKSAIIGRIDRLEDTKKHKDSLVTELALLAEELSHPDIDDRYLALEEELAKVSIDVALMENELPRLKQLRELADNITSETKVLRLIDILKSEFKDRTVVLFTEYKATQALLVNVLHDHFGYGCVSFINGDEKLDGIINEQGKIISLSMDRYGAADKFKSGKVRFIISTEAGGEGIDLQDNCFSMIHVDLPWNPMRLHQRVGRLNRYGQRHKVEVITLRNPDTVESRIWNLLNEKIEKVMQSLSIAMDEPEDLLQIILGMTNTGLFDELFSEGLARQHSDNLSEWFDAKTATFGGQSAIDTVKNLIGHAEKFEYKNLEEVPRLDISDLRDFFEHLVKFNRHKINVDDQGFLSFITPDAWKTQFGIRRKYEKLTFDRTTKCKEAEILGVGHKIFELALNQAQDLDATVSITNVIQYPVFVYMLKDQITGDDGNQLFTMVGMIAETEPKLLSDVDLLAQLSEIANDIPKNNQDQELEYFTQFNQNIDNMKDMLEQALIQKSEKLNLPYQQISPTLIAIFLPNKKESIG